METTKVVAQSEDKIDLAKMRVDYSEDSLDVSTLSEKAKADPWNLFTEWSKEARDARIRNSASFCLTTVDDQGRPTTRYQSNLDRKNTMITWTTYYNAQKGKDLEKRPHAAVTFFYAPL